MRVLVLDIDDDSPLAGKLTRRAAAQALVGLGMDEVERMVITATLERNHGNRDRSARMLNMPIRTLYRKIAEMKGHN